MCSNIPYFKTNLSTYQPNKQTNNNNNNNNNNKQTISAYKQSGLQAYTHTQQSGLQAYTHTHMPQNHAFTVHIASLSPTQYDPGCALVLYVVQSINQSVISSLLDPSVRTLACTFAHSSCSTFVFCHYFIIAPLPI